MPASRPLVSVIIPAHNARKWIAETLASVAQQSWEHIETIVVDDGSDDDTAQVVESVAKPSTLFIRQENRGAAAARNRGIAESHGDLIQFLDADDLLSPEKIALQVSALATAPPRSVASCAWRHFTTDTAAASRDEESVWTISDPFEWLVASLSGGGMMQPASWLTPRSVVDAAGPWNESLSLHDDADFFMRVLLNAAQNVFVTDAVVYYRDVPDSLSRRRGRAAIESSMAVCRLREQAMLKRHDDVRTRRAVATQYAQFAYEFASAAPDLAREAVDAIGRLGAAPAPAVGGQIFRNIASVLGFESAMRLRSAFR
jgi:glycosyltransferase involved in cell wall biosynthesis